MFFSFFFLFFFISFFNNFSKPTFSASSVSIGEKLFFNGKKVNIYIKDLKTQVFDEDLENSFFLSSNPQIFDLSKYQKIDSYEFKDVVDEVKSLKIDAYYDSENDNKRFLIDLNSINDANFPNLSSCLIKDSTGKSIAFESLFLIPVIVEALKNVSSDSIDGIVVDGNKTTITNTNLGLYGLIRINNDDFSKTGTAVDIRAGNKKISIGNSDTGDPVAETGNLTIGNTTGFTHLYGGTDFTIRTANGGAAVLSLGAKNDNSKISIESGTNEIEINKDSTGNINIGNSTNITGVINLNGQININSKGPEDGICFNLLLNNNNVMKGYVNGDLTIGNTAKKLHLYGSEIILFGQGGELKIGDPSRNSSINLQSGTNSINIGTNSIGNISIGNYDVDVTWIDGKNILIGHNGDLLARSVIRIGDLDGGSKVLFKINSDYVKDPSESHAADDNTGSGYYLLMVSQSGNLYRTASVFEDGSSSKRYKENIKKAEVDLEKFKKLLPVTFDYKKEINSGKKDQWGFIAEDVFDLGLTEAVEFDKNGEIYGLNYRTIFMMLLKSYLDSLEKLENFENRINALEEENLSLKNKN